MYPGRSHEPRVEAYRDWLAIAAVNHTLMTVLAVVDLPLAAVGALGLLMGVGFAMAAVTVLHNAGHHRYSRSHWPNALAVHTAAPMGMWVRHWTFKHVVHHRLPAAFPDDSFTDTSGWLRVHPLAPSHDVHRFQHWYAWGLYTLAWPIEIISQLRYLVAGDVPGLGRPLGASRRVASYLLEKGASALILSCYLNLPHGSRLLVALPLAVVVAGLIVTTLVAVGHINVGLGYPLPEKSGIDWRRYVIATTASFGTRSRALAWFTGSLTHHLAHHLRPVASRHELRSVHARLAEDPDTVEFPSLAAAVRGHWVALRALGDPKPLASSDQLLVPVSRNGADHER